MIDGYAGWDPQFRKKARIIATRPYHALFMKVMLRRGPQPFPNLQINEDF